MRVAAVTEKAEPEDTGYSPVSEAPLIRRVRGDAETDAEIGPTGEPADPLVSAPAAPPSAAARPWPPSPSSDPSDTGAGSGTCSSSSGEAGDAARTGSAGVEPPSLETSKTAPISSGSGASSAAFPDPSDI